ncbi:hypothetical protein TNCV_421601 [Trichonephila clavipes]|nr:hypothetical protein TNCV_421601 [Trichonephila clavipes]
MANWHGCPCFPKPPKGAAKTNKNTYTNLYNSFLRPNFSSQVTNHLPRNNSQNKQQMAPRRAETSRQTEAVNIIPTIQIQKETAPPIINSNQIPTTVNPNLLNSNNNNDIKALLSTTVQCLIQL